VIRLRRKAVFTNLGRPRLGLSEGEISMAQRPRTKQLLVMAGAVGLNPIHTKRARDGGSSGRMIREVTPDGR
jgi:hypothetical protein